MAATVDRGDSLSDLALHIASLAHQASTLLKASSQPSLYTNDDTPAATAARASLPADLRTQLADAALDLWALTLGPEERVRRLTIEWTIPAALRYIVHFGIADLVPATGSISYGALARAAHVPEPHLKRIVRLAATAGVFSERVAAHVAHTPLSVRFAQQLHPELASYAAHVLEFTFPVAARMAEMSERWQGSDGKTHTAFNVAHGTDEALFAWLQHEPAHAKRFVGLMDAMRKNPTWDIKHLVDGWQGWAELPAGAKIVDVGGSAGHASIALADRYHDLDFVVQDLPYVVASTKASNSIPEALSGRIQLQNHDFFTEQPIKDADVYLLRQIMHDWADDSAVRILQSIVPALQKAGSRILIMDQVVPPPGTLPRAQEREARTADLVVMSHFNGKQRDLEEWTQLLETADRRLNIVKLVQPAGSHFAIIEVELQAGVPPSIAAPEAIVEFAPEPVGPVTNGHGHAEVEGAKPADVVKESSNLPSVTANGTAFPESNGAVSIPAQNGNVTAASTSAEIAESEAAPPIVQTEPLQEQAQASTSGSSIVAKAESVLNKIAHRKTDSVTDHDETATSPQQADLLLKSQPVTS